MADIVLIAAYGYLILTIAAIIYRFYGMTSRKLARQTANFYLSNSENSRESENGNRLSLLASQILEDRNVTERELVVFSKISLNSFIDEKDKTIEELTNAVRSKDRQLQILGYLLKESLHDPLYVKEIVSKDPYTGNRNLRYGSILNWMTEYRMSIYANELSLILDSHFTKAPKNTKSFVNPELLNKISSSRVNIIGQ